MFIKLLTLIIALFVGGAKAPPSIHKQRQPNTIKGTYVERGDYDWQFYNRFDANIDIVQNWNLEYTIENPSTAKIINLNNNTSESPFLNLNISFEVGHTYLFNWRVETYSQNTIDYFPYLKRSGIDNMYFEPFIITYKENESKLVGLRFNNYNQFLPTDYFIFTLNLIDITTNPIPTFDNSMIELWTEKEVEDEVNVAIENTKNTNYPLYSMKFNYIVNVNETTSDIPLTFRGDDYTHIYKSDLYSAINSRVGSVSNNFTIKIWFPIKNMRDLNIYAKGNNIKLLTNNEQIVYSYTQGNNIFELNLPNKNQDFNYIELSFYDFNSIGANDVILSVSNSVDFNSYQNGFDEGKKVGYEEGSKDGYIEGKENGIQQGEEQGFDKGYDKGYSDGALNKGFNPFTMVSTAFDSVSKLLSVNVFGGITLATLISIPFIFLVVLFILKLIKG